MSHIVGLVNGVDPDQVQYVDNQYVLDPQPEQPVSVGLAMAIGDGHHLLSAWHVVDQDPMNIAVIGRGWNTSYKSVARVFWCFPEDDLVVLQLESPFPVGFSIADQIKAESAVWTYGRQSLFGGEVLETPQSPRDRHQIIATTARGIYGDSGGPLLTVDDEVAGVLVGYRSRKFWDSIWRQRPVSIAVRPDPQVLEAAVAGEATVGSYDVASCSEASG